jgi:putative transposase
MTKPNSPFRYSNSSPEIIRLAVMMYVKFPLSLRNVEDLLHGRGIDISYETVRFWWNRFGPTFAAESAASVSTACGRSRTGGGIWTRST